MYCKLNVTVQILLPAGKISWNSIIVTCPLKFYVCSTSSRVVAKAMKDRDKIKGNESALHMTSGLTHLKLLNYKTVVTEEFIVLEYR